MEWCGLLNLRHRACPQGLLSPTAGDIWSVLQPHRDLQCWWPRDSLGRTAGFQAENLLSQKVLSLEAMVHVDLSAAGSALFQLSAGLCTLPLLCACCERLALFQPLSIVW